MFCKIAFGKVPVGKDRRNGSIPLFCVFAELDINGNGVINQSIVYYSGVGLYSPQVIAAYRNEVQ